MQLSNVGIVAQDGTWNIGIEKDTIVSVNSVASPAPASMNGETLPFKNAVAFPGLINSHDHLDFDLFPALGNQLYESYKEWGTDIHLRNKEAINRVLAIPLPLRVRWGMYKNLLSGITTVVHHGAGLEVDNDLVSVFQEADSYHSVSGEKGWRRKLINPFRKRQPVVIHTGEGTGPAAAAEIDRLLRWNVFGRELVGIHGVAMNKRQAAGFHSLVWCPASNYFLLGKTARIDLLQHATRIVFGTDSTLTASWDIWEHLRLARAQHMVSDAALFDMLTVTPAAVWGLRDRGSLRAGQRADIVVAEAPAGAMGWDAFYAIRPENLLLVMHKGNVNLLDGELYLQMRPVGIFSKVTIDGRVKYVRGDLQELVDQIRQYHPSVNLPVSCGS